MTKDQQVQPSFLLSILPVLLLVGMLTLNIIIYGDDATYGANQISLFITAFIIAGIGVFKLKLKYKQIETKALESVGVSLQANMILLLVGALIGTWILSGVVPAMIYYGIKLISPSVFLPVACIICCVVSMATGSSWSTAGTVGIALMGIGASLGIPAPMIAGAVISGAYFGDKLSLLSETTNLAPAMVGVDLFAHVKHLLYTTVPAITIAIIGFSVLGIFYRGESLSANDIEMTLGIIRSHFYISPWLFVLPLLIFGMIAKRVPAIPALLIGALAGGVMALIFQQDLIKEMSGGGLSIMSSYDIVIRVMYEGFKIETGNELIDKLFTRGGMISMLNTIWLIFVAMTFGGMMEVTGMLNTIAQTILKMVKGTVSLVTATISSALFLNVTTSDQYISIVLTGRMFRSAYEKLNLHPKNLSRAVEDGATVTSVLVPWNTCGAYFSGVLGVATLSYLPFAFFNLLSPLISIIIAVIGTSAMMPPREAVVEEV